MIKCIEKPYVGTGMEKKRRKFLHNLLHQKKQYKGYVLTLPLGLDGLLDMYPVYVLNQKFYQKQEITVVGVAKDKQEAVLLAKRIIDECYEKRSDVLVSEFIRDER